MGGGCERVLQTNEGRGVCNVVGAKLLMLLLRRLLLLLMQRLRLLLFLLILLLLLMQQLATPRSVVQLLQGLSPGGAVQFLMRSIRSPHEQSVLGDSCLSLGDSWQLLRDSCPRVCAAHLACSACMCVLGVICVGLAARTIYMWCMYGICTVYTV